MPSRYVFAASVSGHIAGREERSVFLHLEYPGNSGQSMNRQSWRARAAQGLQNEFCACTCYVVQGSQGSSRVQRLRERKAHCLGLLGTQGM